MPVKATMFFGTVSALAVTPRSSLKDQGPEPAPPLSVPESFASLPLPLPPQAASTAPNPRAPPVARRPRRVRWLARALLGMAGSLSYGRIPALWQGRR